MTMKLGELPTSGGGSSVVDVAELPFTLKGTVGTAGATSARYRFAVSRSLLAHDCRAAFGRRQRHHRKAVSEPSASALGDG